MPCDVRSEKDVMNALDITEKKFGRLDVVANVAGISRAFITFNFNKNVPHKLEDFIDVSEESCARRP